MLPNYMKKDIHPTYHDKIKVKCACGNEFETGATVEEINVELCHMCHPFYTGKQKLVDSARRVEKFQEKLSKQVATSKARQGKKAKRAKRAQKQASKKEK